MAVTASLYSHAPKLFANKEVDFTKIKVKLLNGSAFNAAHTAVNQVDNGAAPATVTISVASPAVVSWAAHGFSAGQPVMFKVSAGGALPTGLSPDTYYYVLAAGLAAGSFEVAATPGGAAINTTVAGSGTITGYATGTLEVQGNGWPSGGPTLANVVVSQAAINDATNNDAMLDADDVIQTASEGLIGPATAALIYDSVFMKPLGYIDFGQTQTAGDTTDFKIRWNVSGIFNWIM